MVGHTARILAEHGQAHGNVEPVKHMLGCWSDEFGQGTHFLATIGQEGNVLVYLQTLALERVEQPVFRLGIVAMLQSNVAGMVLSRILSHDAARRCLQ